MELTRQQVTNAEPYELLDIYFEHILGLTRGEYKADDCLYDKDGAFFGHVEDLDPTTNTETGRSLSFDLMVKYGLVRFYEPYDLIGYNWSSLKSNGDTVTPHVTEYNFKTKYEEGPQIAILRACLLAKALEGEKVGIENG